MLRRLILTVLCSVIAAHASFADEVRLKNGDRYTGEVVALTGGTLTFKATYGTVTIPWTDVAGIVIDAPLLIAVAKAPPVSAVLSTSDGTILLPGGAFTLADITALARPLPPLAIDGGANAGLVATGGNTDINNLRLDADVVIRRSANRYTVGAVINRAADHDVEMAENWTASGKYDRFLTSRLFVNANAIFTHDSFRDLDLRTALGAGLGYQIVNTPRLKLAADAGVAYVKENVATGPDDSYTAAHESANLDVFVLPGRVKLFHVHDGYFGGSKNLFIRTQNGARVGLAAGLVTTIEWDLDYDRSPAPGRDTTDRTFALTFGYRFKR
jgi:putative salt-induced outer membrane protein YdiY